MLLVLDGVLVELSGLVFGVCCVWLEADSSDDDDLIETGVVSVVVFVFVAEGAVA
jgi:hypothetical protein